MTHCRGNVAATDVVSIRVMKGEWVVGSKRESRMS